jgi:hypothetical protein
VVSWFPHAGTNIRNISLICSIALPLALDLKKYIKTNYYIDTWEIMRFPIKNNFSPSEIKTLFHCVASQISRRFFRNQPT